MKILALLALAGCATLADDRTRAVVVTSQQPGAAVLVAGRRVAETPTTLVLRVDVPADVRIVAPDGRVHACSSRTTVQPGLVALQSLLVPFWIGLAVDAWTGAWNEIDRTCVAPW